MGVAEPDKLPVTLSTVIADIIKNRNADPMEAVIEERDTDPSAGIIHHSEGIDLLPANNSLTGIEIALAPVIGRETVLRQYIDKVKPLYDYVLLDTCPTLDLLTVNALAAADSAIIPVVPRFLDSKGLELLLKSICTAKPTMAPKRSCTS
jgi:chromosome partitioning protein